jgi:predicted Zn-dependent protease
LKAIIQAALWASIRFKATKIYPKNIVKMSLKTPNTPAAQTTKPTPDDLVWLGFGRKEPTGRGTVRIRLRWGMIVAAMALLFATAWVGKTFGLYYFFKNVRNFEEVTVTDMFLFPLNRESVRRQQGDYQVDQAKTALENQDFRRALVLLQQGVSRSPANLEGRNLLIQLYLGWRPDLAMQLLDNGYAYGKNNEEFVRIYCALLIQQREDADLVALTDRLLADATLDAKIHHLAAVSRMQIDMLHGRFAAAADLYQTRKLYQTLDGILIATDMMVRTGDATTAIQILQSIIRQFPDQPLDAVFRRLAAIHRQAGDLARARQVALDYSIRNAMRWEPRILMVEILAEGDDDTRLDREVEAIIREFRNQEGAMLSLGQIAADRGKTRTATRLYELALENNYNLGTFSLLLIESYVKDRQFQRAIQYCNELVRENPEWLTTMESVFNGIRSLAYFGIGNQELGSLYLRDFMSARRTTVPQLIQAAEAFTKFGFETTALALLQEAYNRDEDSELALSKLVDMKIRVGDSYNLAHLLRRLPAMRRPAYALIESIETALHSDRFLFTRGRQEIIATLQQILTEPKIEGLDLVPPQQPAA